MALKQIAPEASEVLNADSVEEPQEETAAPAERRIAANRANARRSTGPRTPEGKVRSAQNALKHGLFARTLALAAEPLGEARAEFDALHAELTEHHDPQGPEEALLVERIATAWWLLARLTAQGQRRPRQLLDGGADPLDALKESEGTGPAEARLVRSLMRMHRNLAFLQKWRGDREQRSEQAARKQAARQRNAWEAAYHVETERQIQEGLRRSRERREAERAGQESDALEDAAPEDLGGDADAAREPLDQPEAVIEDAEAGEEPGEQSAA